MFHLLACLGSLVPLILAATTVNVPSKPPSSAYTIDPSFPNIALEFASLFNFASTSDNDTTPNQYSINMLNAIFSRTGGHPIIRIGGTSADYSFFVADQAEPVIPIPTRLVGSNVTNTTFGPSFWPLTRNFASTGATFIPQLSLAINNQSQIEEQARAVADGIGLENIEQIEIGNEPNFYPFPDAGPPNFVGALNNTSYADRFKAYASVISSAIPLSNDSEPFFLAGDIGDIVAPPFYYPLNVSGIFEAGVNSDGIVQAIAGHYYQITNGTLAALLNHSNIVTHMAEQKGWVDYLAANYGDSIPLVMDEANVLTGPTNETLMSSLGSAVWRTDYFFYCMSIGIKRVHYESVFGSNQSLWQPFDSDGTPAQTRGAFYAYPPAADFIGNTGGKTKVAQIQVDGSIDGTHFTAYAAYNGSTIARIALVNFNEWSEGEGTTRPNTTISLTGLGDAKSIKVKYLSNDEGAAGLASTITYGGSQWTAKSQGQEVYGVRDDTVYGDVKDGKSDVVVPYTAVAIVFLE